jgi:hypothetical protein
MLSAIDRRLGRPATAIVYRAFHAEIVAPCRGEAPRGGFAATDPSVAWPSSSASRARAGANLRQIQELFGHKQLDSTQRYTRVNAHELRGAIKRLRWVG